MKRTIQSVANLFGFEIRRLVQEQPSQRANQTNSQTPAVDPRWKAILKESVRTVIDVGANNGEFAQMARHYCPNSAILCFEPLPDCQESLATVGELIGNCQIFPFALGDRDCETTMHVNEWNASSSLLQMNKRHVEEWPFTEQSRDITVTVQRLDAVLSKDQIAQPCIMKLDVQGFELKALRGAEMLLPCVSAIVLETSSYALYEEQSKFADVYKFLMDHDFVFRGAIDTCFSTQDDSILQFDALFERNSK